MTTTPPVTVRVTRRFSASRERVFDVWLDPDRAGKFLFAPPRGQLASLEIDRPRRLVFTLVAEKYSQDLDRVILDIVPLGSGCELTLTREMKPQWAEDRDRIESGWIGIVDGLAKTLDESAARG